MTHESAEQERLYNVIAINERNGSVEVLTSSPLSHREACTIMGRFTPAKHVRIQLEDAPAGPPPASVKVIEHGTWSWSDGKERPAFVVLVHGRVWGSYCYRGAAEQAASRLTGRERVDGMPPLADYNAWRA